MTARVHRVESPPTAESEAASASDPLLTAAERVREQVARHPYAAMLMGGGLGCLLGRLPRRMQPGLFDLAIRVALAAILRAAANGSGDVPGSGV